MPTSDVVVDMQLNRLKGIISNALDTTDKALLIEKEVGLETLYTMVAMGHSLASISSSLGVSTFEMEYILQRTNNHRKQYLNAKTLALSKSSVTALGLQKDALELETEESAAMRHHASMLDKALKVVNATSSEQGGNNIVVNNTVVVRSRDDIPPLPNELKNIIEG